MTAAIRDYFEDSKVERAEYEDLINDMPGGDPDDHEHAAAAVVRQPCTILTHNKHDFPSKPLSNRGVRVTDPDTYLSELGDELPDKVADTIVRLAGEKRRPPKTARDLLDDLAHAGVPRFATKIRSLLAERGE